MAYKHPTTTMKKIFLTLAFMAIATSIFAYSSYRSPGDEIGEAIIGWAITIMAILNIVLFSKIWTMTKDVHQLKEQLCPNGHYEYQLRQKIVELKHMGKSDEAKKMLDEHLKNEVFVQLLVNSKSVNPTKKKVEECFRKYEKYYRYLNFEMPDEIKKIDVEKVKEEYSSLWM